MRARLLGTAAVLLLGSGWAAAGPVPKLETLTLDNGLTVLVRRVTSARDAAVVVLYRVGNRMDPDGRSGMASLIAGLYHAAATAKVAARSPQSLLPRLSRGTTHALGWTEVAADDHTFLGRTLPSEDVATEIDDAADRMAGLVVTDVDLSHAASSLRERLANLDAGRVPVETARLRARERLALLPHDGRRLGRADQVAAITLEEVKARLQKFYVPSNAILSITGDVSPAAVRAQVRKRFGVLLPVIPPPQPLARPEQPTSGSSAGEGPEVLELPAGAAGAGAALALRAPYPAASPAYAAYLVLATRLWDAANVALVRAGRGTTDTVGTVVDILSDAEAIYLTWRPPADVTTEAARAKLVGALNAAATRAVTNDDVLRTRSCMNMYFGVPPIAGTWGDDPLSVAHADAFRAQLGLDGEAVMKLVPSVSAEDLADVAARSSALVLARPGR